MADSSTQTNFPINKHNLAGNTGEQVGPTLIWDGVKLDREGRFLPPLSPQFFAPLQLGSQKKLVLGRKNTGGAFPLPPSYVYVPIHSSESPENSTLCSYKVKLKR
jgi:hypothetical protein